MKNKKGIFQKTSLAFAVISFVLSVVSGFMLYFRLDEVNDFDPVNSSFLASFFFFICIGFVLTVIGKANIPSFKVGDSEIK